MVAKTTLCFLSLDLATSTGDYLPEKGHKLKSLDSKYRKKCYDRAFHLANKMHDFTGMHYVSGKFCYDDFFRKSHARLYTDRDPSGALRCLKPHWPLETIVAKSNVDSNVIFR